MSSIRQVVAPSRKVWPGARLVDHLLVELAHAAAVGEVDAVEAAVGDRARVGHGELAGALAPADDARGPVPGHPRPQLGEALRRIAAVEHVEHVLELLAPELGERLGGGDHPLHLVDVPLDVGDHRDDVLGEHVERVARDHRLLDQPLAHPLRDHGALEQVRAELREDPALRDLTEGVARAADALEAARDRLRRLDLDHEVHGAHVDPQLERGGRDQAGQLPALEHLLDHQALLVRERAVVGAGDLDVALLRPGARRRSRRAPWPAAPARAPRSRARSGAWPGAPRRGGVDEDDRRVVLADQLEQLRVDRGPDRARGVGAGSNSSVSRACRRRPPRARHVLHRHDDLEVELLRDAGVDDRAFALRADQELKPTRSSGRCVAERPIRCTYRGPSRGRPRGSSRRDARGAPG